MEKDHRRSLPRGTYVQVLETVPAECVLAVLAHHLSTAFVAFDINPADWALLNGGICICPKEGARSKVDEKLQGGHGKQCLIFNFFFFNARTSKVDTNQSCEKSELGLIN